VWLVATEIKVLGAYKPHLSEPEPPVKLVYKRHSMSAFEIYLPEISALEREHFETPPADKRHNKVGIHRDIPGHYLGQLVPRLNWQMDDKGTGTVAYLMLHSPGAKFIRVRASLKLPPQASLNYFELDALGKPKVIFSPNIDSEGFHETEYWSPLALGETIGVEIRLPSKNSIESVEIEFLKASHGFTDWTSFGGDCSGHVEIQCAIDDGDISEDSASSTIQLYHEDDGVVGYTNACSATLLNVPNDGENVWKPYIMTAAHCIDTQENADSVGAAFNFQYDTCPFGVIDQTAIYGGADLLASSSDYDMSLLEFRFDVPDGTYFSGWQTLDVGINETGFGAQHVDLVSTKKFFSGVTGGNFDVGDLQDAIQLNTDKGAIEGGSSGAGLRIGDEELFVGVLSISSDCSDDSQSVYFGKFRNFYPEVEQWLNPVTVPVDDHGDTKADATIVSLNTTVDGTLEVVGDVDYLAVEVVTSGTLKIYTSGSVDTAGTVTNAAGTVSYTDDNSGTGQNFLISFAAKPDTYYIAVEGDGAATGDYILHVEFIADNDHGDTEDTATAVDLGDSIDGQFNNADDTDYFVIDVVVAGKLEVYTTSSIDTVGTVTNAAGTVSHTDDDSGTGQNFLISFAAEPDTYYIAVESDGAATGYYTLHVDFEPSADDDPVEDDHGDTEDTATEIFSDAHNWVYDIVGFVDDDDDLDVFQLELAHQTKLTIHTAGEMEIAGSFTNSEDEEIWEIEDTDDDNLNFMLSTIVDAGIYYLYISGAVSEEKSQYELKIETDVYLYVDGEIEETIFTDADKDYYYHETDSEGMIEIYTTGTMDTIGAVTNAAGTVDLTDDNSGTDENFLISFLAEPGTYYIEVDSSSDSTGDYTLHVEFEPSAEDDHGDTEDTATVIEPNSSTSGKIEEGDDIDYFEIEIPRAGDLTVYTRGGLDTIGTVTNEDGTVEETDDDSGTSYNFSISLEVSDGTYFVKVESWGDHTGSYTLLSEFKVDYSVPTPAVPDPEVSETTISSDADAWDYETTSVIASEEENIYKIVLSHRTQLTLYTTGQTDTAGILKDADEDEIQSHDDISTSDDPAEENLNFMISEVVEAGIYYLHVSGAVEDKSQYTLKIEADVEDLESVAQSP